MIGFLALGLGLAVLASAMKKKPTADGGRNAIRALRRNDDAALRRAATEWQAVGDTMTAEMLRYLAERMVNARKGVPQVAAPVLDPDDTKSAGLGELIARIGQLETRIMNLVGWAQAFGAEGLVKTAEMLQAKAVNTQAALNAKR